MNTTSISDHVQSVHELNRAFLGVLQQRSRGGLPALGLPSAIRPWLGAAPSSLLDALADFPGALFRLSLDSSDAVPLAAAESTPPPDEAQAHLATSILYAVRGVTRQSAYQAQVLYGLRPVEVERCRLLTLDDFRRLARVPDLLRCANADRPWFWHGLLAASQPESRRHLALMALQPALPHGWPLRRAPHSTR